MRAPFVAAFFAVCALSVRGGAQVVSSEEAAHSGIVLTPIGALPEVTRIDQAGDATSRVETQFRYGVWESSAAPVRFQNFGTTVLYRLTHKLAVGGTLGYRRCGECIGLALASADAQMPIWRQTNERPGEGFMDIGLQGSAGFGRANNGNVSARSIGAWIPISVSIPETNDAFISLAFVPGVAYGYLTDHTGSVLGYTGSDGGTRALLGGSFNWLFAMGLGLHASFHRVIIANSPNHFGLAVSWRFGTRRTS